MINSTNIPKLKVRISLFFALMIMVLCFTTACQPTPEENVIGSKNKDLIEEVIDANESNPEVIQESKEVVEEQIKAINLHLNMDFQPSDRTKVIVDAEVIIPAFAKIPLVRVVPENLTKEHLEILINETTDGQSVYYQPTGKSIWSKDELDSMILSYKEMIQNPELPSHIKGHINSRIGFLEEIYGSSPSKGSEKIFDGTLTEIEDNKYYSTVTTLKSYLNRNCAARIELWQSFNKTKNQLVFRNQDDGVVYNKSIPFEGQEAPNIEMSYDKAKNIADNLVSKLDGQYSNLKLLSSGVLYMEEGFLGTTYETSPHAYSYSFVREYNGVLVKPRRYLHGISDNINYREQVQPEVLSITIDDGGIVFFGWQRYTKFKSTIADDVPLMEFDAIQKIFEDYMGYKFAWVPPYDNIPDDATTTIRIHTVELNLMPTAEKDNVGNYVIIPVWDFVGDMDYNQEIIMEDGYKQQGEHNIAILTINAIDGTVIDREQGY